MATDSTGRGSRCAPPDPAGRTGSHRARMTATVEVSSMNFRVARDDLADAVAWVAKSPPTRPPVPVLGGILLEVQGSTLTVAGFDYEVSTRATVSVDTLESFPDAKMLPADRSRRRTRAGVRSAAGRDRQVAAGGQPVHADGGRAAGVDRRRFGAVHPADRPCRSRTTPAAADAQRVRVRRRGRVRRGGGADRGGRPDDTLPMLTGIRRRRGVRRAGRSGGHVKTRVSVFIIPCDFMVTTAGGRQDSR